MTGYISILLALLLITLTNFASPATSGTYDVRIKDELGTTPLNISCHTNTNKYFPEKSLQWSFWYRFNLSIDGQTQSASCNLKYGNRKTTFEVFNNTRDPHNCPQWTCDWKVRENDVVQLQNKKWKAMYKW
ncbi:hypothetical protein PHJA_001764300 [Phtheirospermum japonicum]|uniref:S-protein homolog n=1 Tax=Phtheirospermum japonicum TaxID=374723 RepID=A0A830CD01_9LAMI|nr:hypothetical protein PHJA_001764300 [Phtheirospermum japonicum]